VSQRADDVLLSHQRCERARPPFSREDLISHATNRGLRI
jgi:hypothetical protein